MHQVVTAQLAAARPGTQSTKTRAEVRGGGAKPWRQKGTGRARARVRSVRRSWRGGGVALGPKPRSYAQRTPKKMKRLALRSRPVGSCRSGNGSSSSTSGRSMRPAPRTPSPRSVRHRRRRQGPRGAGRWRRERGQELPQPPPRARASTPAELNTYDVLVSDWSCSPRRPCRSTAAAVRRPPAEVPAAAVASETPSRTSRPKPTRPMSRLPRAMRKRNERSRDVILEPVVCEKSYGLLEDNVYTFKVHPERLQAGDPRRGRVDLRRHGH